MDVDEIIYESIKYPRSSLGKVAILGVFLLVPYILLGAFILIGLLNNFTLIGFLMFTGFIVLLFTMLVIFGYLFRVVKTSLAGLKELPSFNNWGQMLLEGLEVGVVFIVYYIFYGLILLIPLFILGVLGTGLAGAFTVLSLSDTTSLFGSGLLLWVVYLIIFFVYLLAFVLGIIFAVVLPISIANMARHDDFGAAFNFSEIKERLKDIRWGKAIVWLIATQFVLVIAIFISIITGLLLIGFILVPLLIMPYMAIFYARSVALLYISGDIN